MKAITLNVTRRTLLVAAVLFLAAVWSFAARHERLIDSWKPLHYSVNLSINDTLTEITVARTEITILILKDKVAAVDLDFGSMIVDAALVNNRPAEFEHQGQRLNLKLPALQAKGASLVVAIVYHGKPSDGLIMVPDKDGHPSVVGDNWPNRLHHWIPSLDHPSAKATITFRVTAPGRNLVVANGRLDRLLTNSDATRTWVYHERVPIPPYCMIVAVGQFAKLEPSKPAVTPLSYYVPQSDQKLALQGFATADLSLKLFSQTVAPYPYEKLALIVGATRFGGMENSSAIVFSSTLFSPRSDAQPVSRVFKIRSGIVSLVAHEIAHQWFGDSVTESTWSDLWLSEGFATYFAGLFIQKYEGERDFQEYMRAAADTYFGYARNTRTPLFDLETENLSKLLNANNYQKGAWVLHMLRSSLGDKSFFRGLRAYYRNHKNSTANSEDLRFALEKASGSDLRVFFRSWVYGAGHPRYELSWNWNDERRLLQMSLKQLQPEPFFPNALAIDIITKQGRRRVILKPESKEMVRKFRLSSAPIDIQLDPQNAVLKEVSPSNNQLVTRDPLLECAGRAQRRPLQNRER